MNDAHTLHGNDSGFASSPSIGTALLWGKVARDVEARGAHCRCAIQVPKLLGLTQFVSHGGFGGEGGCRRRPAPPPKGFGVGPFRPTFRAFNCASPNFFKGLHCSFSPAVFLTEPGASVPSPARKINRGALRPLWDKGHRRKSRLYNMNTTLYSWGRYLSNRPRMHDGIDILIAF